MQWSGRAQDPPPRGDLCRVGARPVGPSDSPRLFQDVPSTAVMYYGTAWRGRRLHPTQGSEPCAAEEWLSGMRRLTMTTASPRGLLTSKGSTQGARWADARLSRERGACQG